MERNLHDWVHSRGGAAFLRQLAQEAFQKESAKEKEPRD